MFEIAATDGYRVVLHVPDHDIARVRNGQPGVLRLTGPAAAGLRLSRQQRHRDGERAGRRQRLSRRGRVGRARCRRSARECRASARSSSARRTCSRCGRGRRSTGCASRCGLVVVTAAAPLCAPAHGVDRT
jgi:hypothetical protein